MSIAEVNCFHGATSNAQVLCRAAVFRVAIVKAAALVRGIGASVPAAAHDGVDRLGLVPRGDAASVVDVIAETRVEPHPVHANVVADGDRVSAGVDQAVPLRQMVLHGALVEHAEDDTVLPGPAKRVVLRLVRETAWLERTDGQLLLRLILLHDVQATVVLGIQSAHCRMRGHARVARGARDVAGGLSGGGGHGEDGEHPSEVVLNRSDVGLILL